MKNFNLKLLAIISIISILVICCYSFKNVQKTANEAKVNVICQDVSNIKDEAKPINVEDIEDGALISLPENTVRNFGFIDKENLIILIENSEESPASLCLYNIYTNILKEIGKGKNLKFQSLSQNKKKILYSINHCNITKHRKHYVYDIEKNLSGNILNGWSDAVFADSDGRYVLHSNFREILDLKTGKTKTYGKFPGSWSFSLHDAHPFPNNKFYFDGDHIIYKESEQLACHNVGIYSLDIETMYVDEPILLFPEVVCTLDNGPSHLYSIHQFDFINNGKSIIFEGTYEKYPGIYIYDIDTKEIKKVASGFISSYQPQVIRGISYNLSNDKTKILFSTYENNNQNPSIYLAQININTIISEECLYKDISTYGALHISSWWSPDDNFFLINEKEYSLSQEKWILDEIRKFNITQ